MAAQLMQMISELALQGRWDEAHKALTEYSAELPDDPLVQYQLGQLYFNLGDFEQAITHLTRSLSLSGGNPDVQYQLGLALLKAGKPEEAIPLFHQVIERKPNFVLGHLHWGIALAATGNVKEALEQFLRVVKINPNLAIGQYQAALMNLAMGQLPEAHQLFKRTSQLDPNWAAAFIGMGQTHMAMGNANEAISCFATASSIEPEDNGIRKSWAATLLTAGRYDEAIRIYQSIINFGAKVSARERAMAYNDWGVALFRQGKLEEAAERLLQAAAIDPAVLDSRINLGLIHLMLQEHDLALETFENARQNAPDSPILLMYIAIAELFKGLPDEALAKLKQLRSDNFGHPDLDLWLGYASIAAGQIGDAEQFLEQALKADQRNYLALDALGCCFAAKGEHDKALQQFGMCLNLKRDYGLGHLHAARSLEAIGEAQTAKAEYAAAVSMDKHVLLPEKEVIEHLLSTSQFDAVLHKSQKILALKPDDSDAKLALAKALKEANQYNDALAILESMLGEEPQNGPAYVLAGQIFLAEGRFVEADDMFRKAADLYEGDAPLYYSWGKTLALLGLHELALEKYARAADIDPYDGDVYEAWGEALKYLGRYSEASAVYKRATDYL